MGDLTMALVYLLPVLPLFLAWGRARIEWEAYVETIRATDDSLLELTIEVRQRQFGTASQTPNTGADNCEADDVALRAFRYFEAWQLGIDGDRTRRGRVEGAKQLRPGARVELPGAEPPAGPAGARGKGKGKPP